MHIIYQPWTWNSRRVLKALKMTIRLFLDHKLQPGTFVRQTRSTTDWQKSTATILENYELWVLISSCWLVRSPLRGEWSKFQIFRKLSPKFKIISHIKLRCTEVEWCVLQGCLVVVRNKFSHVFSLRCQFESIFTIQARP